MIGPDFYITNDPARREAYVRPSGKTGAESQPQQSPSDRKPQPHRRVDPYTSSFAERTAEFLLGHH